MRIRHAEPSDHGRVAAAIDDWWGGRHMRDMLARNSGSLAFHRRLGFEVESEIEDYDGAGESRVLLAKAL